MINKEELRITIEMIINKYPNLSSCMNEYWQSDGVETVMWKIVDYVAYHNIDAVRMMLEDSLPDYIDSKIPAYYMDMVDYINKYHLFSAPVTGTSNLANEMKNIIYDHMRTEISEELDKCMADLEDINIADFKEYFEEFHKWLTKNAGLKWAASIPYETLDEAANTEDIKTLYEHINWTTRSKSSIEDIFLDTIIALTEFCNTKNVKPELKQQVDKTEDQLMFKLRGYKWTVYLAAGSTIYQLFKKVLKEYLYFCEEYDGELDASIEWHSIMNTDTKDRDEFMLNLLDSYNI